ncbi:hypothetical protein [Thiolapillus sp.]
MSKLILVFLVSIFLSGQALSDTVYSCSGCSMVSKASSIAHAQKSGSFSLVDITNEKIASYRVVMIYEEGVRRFMAIPTPVPRSIQADFSTVIALKRDVQRQMNALTIPRWIADSAYELTNSPYVQASVGDYIRENRSIATQVGHLAAAALQLLGRPFSSDFQFGIVVEFYDGSKAPFLVSVDALSGEEGLNFYWVPERSRDADGNQIPNSKPDLDALFYFSPFSGALDGFLGAVNTLGGTVTFVGGFNSSTAWHCSATQTVSSATVSCRPVYY